MLTIDIPPLFGVSKAAREVAALASGQAREAGVGRVDEGLGFPRAFRSWQRRIPPLLLVLVAAVVLPRAASGTGPTTFAGTISTDTTWSLANSPYVLTGQVTVAAGVTLTVEPGVVVKQSAGQTYGISVHGTLHADGSASAPITFTSSADSAPGQWDGLYFWDDSGASTLRHVSVRNGGANTLTVSSGEVTVYGGTLTIEDTTVTDSAGSGLYVFKSAAVPPVVAIRRSKFEHNGFVGTSYHGDGLYAGNVRVVVEDSAFWSNASDGIDLELTSLYGSQASSEISGSSFWGNRRRGVYIGDSSGTQSLAPDGNIAGKPGNAIYDNGTFGFSSSETWQQFVLFNSSLDADWRGTYWGPVTFVPCDLGSENGHLSYGVPDPVQFGARAPLGPVSRKLDINPSPFTYCANDDALVNEPVLELPDLYFDAPPPVFGGIAGDQTYGCLECQREASELALSLDTDAAPVAYTENPVNTATGSLTEVATDVRLAGPDGGFEWMRSYNSADTTGGALGIGWRHPFEAKITVVNGSTGELEYQAGSGQRTHFTKRTGGSTGAATYLGKGFDGTLSRLSNGSYELVTRDRRKFSFDSAGNLTAIKPRFTAATTLTYTGGKLSSITDGAGRAISLSYTTADPTLIERVTLPDGRYVQYGYTGGRLTSVRDLRGKSWTLSYGSSGGLQSILDPSGHYQVQSVVYSPQSRVTSEEDGAGNATTYSYSTDGFWDVTEVSVPERGSWLYRHRANMLFEIVDPLGQTTRFTYDRQGHRATTNDPRGNTSRYEYDASGNLTKEIGPPPSGYVVERTYNSSGDLLTETDGRGNTTTYGYAAAAGSDYQQGQLQTVTDREGGVTTFTYWTATSSPAPAAPVIGLLKATTDARGKTTSYGYDTQANLSAVTSPLGLKTTIGYDSSGRRTSLRDPRGNAVTPANGFLSEWSYDDGDNVSSFTDARGNATSYAYLDNGLPWKVTRTDRDGSPRVTSYAYDSDNRLWQTTDPRNGVETRLYWADGQLKSIQSPEGRQTSYAYDAAGRLTTVVEPNGNAAGATASDWTWTYGYDAAGNRTSASHPDGGTTTIAYDELNRPVAWTDPLNHTSSASYDANDNLTSRTDPLSHTRSYGYDKLDRQTSETDERGKTWTTGYFPTGQVASDTTPLGDTTSYTLDDDGRVATMVEPRGNASGVNPADYTWTYGYDEAGNRTRVTDPLGNQTDTGYDALNEPTEITDPLGNTTTLGYDVLNRLWKVTPPAAGATGTLDTVYAYDPAGNLASRTDPNGHETSWSYDLDGRLTQRTTAVGSWNYSYDPNGTLTALETPSGSSTPTAGDGTIGYGHDRMGRQTGVDYSDSTPDVSRGYDLAGRLTSMSDGAGSVGYSYDDADRLTAISRSGADAGLNGSLGYGYDDAGNITGRSYPDSTTVSESFDDDGRLASVSSGGATTSFAYDAAGNLTAVTQPSGNGYVESRGYDRAGRLTSVDNAKSGTSLSKFVWTLDAAGNPTQTLTSRAGGDVYDLYEYDARNRLTGVCYDVGQSATSCSGATNMVGYGYDKVSNRLQEIRSGSVGNTGTIGYSYNSADELVSTTRSGVTTSYSYDANGNLAGKGGRSYSYDLADRLVSTSDGSTTTSYGYDGDGRRISADSGTGSSRFVWDPLAADGIPELLLERDSSGSLIRRYLNGPDGPLSFSSSAGSFSYQHDPLGSITDVTDAAGSAQWRYSYEPYGEPLDAADVSGAAPDNPLRFTGQYLDSETGDYHLRARQYDPSLGSFDGLDPVEPALTEPYDGAYVYADGQPTVLVDPLGLIGRPSWKSVRRVGGGVLGAAKDTVSALTPYATVTGAARATFARAHAAYQTYKDYGSGLTGLQEAFNQDFNPAYSFLVDQHLCRGSGGYAAGYHCASAVRDAAFLIAGARGAGSIGRCGPARTVAAEEVPEVNWAAQEKHFVGHNSYIPGRSELTADPRKLVQRAGTGDPVGSVPRGEPGFKERIDFGERIGTYVDPSTGQAKPTSRGILHYSKRGVHIVPSRP